MSPWGQWETSCEHNANIISTCWQAVTYLHKQQIWSIHLKSHIHAQYSEVAVLLLLLLLLLLFLEHHNYLVSIFFLLKRRLKSSHVRQ